MTTSGGTSAGPPFRKECRLDEEANATLVPQGATCRTKKGRRGSSRLCKNDLIPSVPFSLEQRKGRRAPAFPFLLREAAYSALAASTTWAVVMPKCLYSWSAGAEAPSEVVMDKKIGAETHGGFAGCKVMPYTGAA